MSPQSIWLWRSVMLIFRRLRRLWEIETPFWKDRHKILSVVGTGADGSKEPGSDPPADLGESPREAGGNWSSRWGKDTAGSHSGEPVLLWGHWCWQVPFWNTPSSLLMSGPRSLHPPPTSAGTPQARQLTRWDTAPTTSRQGTLTPLSPQQSLNMTLATTGPTTQRHIPVWRHQSQTFQSFTARDTETQPWPPAGRQNPQNTLRLRPASLL